MRDPITRAAEVLHRGWRGLMMSDARRMAQDLDRRGLLAKPLPDPEYGLALDDQGRSRDGISCALQDWTVSLIATGGEGVDCALVLLRPHEAEELGNWMLAAARVLKDRGADR